MSKVRDIYGISTGHLRDIYEKSMRRQRPEREIRMPGLLQKDKRRSKFKIKKWRGEEDY
jgi:hypothetical protein